MPTYDVECSACGHADIVVMKMAELTTWDAAAVCPECKAASPTYCRVIRQAPAVHGGNQTIKSKLEDNKKRFVKSGERDDMRHKASKKVDRGAIEAARESVKRGEFEGF